jgi:hypothetical protein
MAACKPPRPPLEFFRSFSRIADYNQRRGVCDVQLTHFSARPLYCEYARQAEKSTEAHTPVRERG